jgi:hypothetical protein
MYPFELKIKQVRIHVQFMCHYHDVHMQFTIEESSITVVSQPFLVYITSKISVFSNQGIQHYP